MSYIVPNINKVRQPIIKRKISKMLSSAGMLNILYIPAMILFIMFLFYPFIKGIFISFTNWDGYSQDYRIIGFENYTRMFSDITIKTVIYNTMIYGVGSTIFQNVLGLVYAIFLNHKMRTSSIAKTIIYLPVIISPLIMGYIWYFFFQFDGGAINDIILLFSNKPLNLLADPKINVWIITFVNTYQFMGVAMVIYLAGLQTIPQDYYEAADLDGASGISKFRNITLPLLAPSITINVVLNLIGGLKLYDVIWAMTGGGPGYSSCSLSTLMYQLYFARQDAGYASAVGILMFAMISVISITALIFLRKKEIII